MKRIYVLVLLLGVGSIIKMEAQQLPVNNQYLVNPYSLSPAFAGYNETFETFVGYRKDWVGIQGSPETKMINLNAPVSKHIALGGSIVGDQTDIFKTTSASLSYTYRVNLTEKHKMAFSVWGSLFQSYVDLSDILVQSNQDPLLANQKDLNERSFNAGAAVLYSYSGLNVGFLVPTLLERKGLHEVSSSGNIITLQRQYVGHASYIIRVDSLWHIEPMFIGRYVQNCPFSFDVAAAFRFREKLWLGITYRNTAIAGLSIGGKLSEEILLNYTYEFAQLGSGQRFSGAGILAESNGTHEVSIGFRLSKKKKKPIEQQPVVCPVTTQMVDSLKQQVESLNAELKKMVLEQENEISIAPATEPELFTKDHNLATFNLNPDSADFQDKVTTIEKQYKDFYVIVGVFRYQRNVDRITARCTKEGYSPLVFFNKKKKWYYVYLNKYSKIKEALEKKDELRAKGFEGAWVYYE